ncbi:hypothetical protein N9917_01095 [Deltaproteobacteria bacterium]|nr:hypothetical protein [Deltaproteobacteria bacterium]
MAATRIGSEFTYTSGTPPQQYRYTVLADQSGNISVRNVQSPYGLIMDSMTSTPASVQQDICDSIEQVESILASTSPINGTLVFAAVASMPVNFATPLTSTSYRVHLDSSAFVGLRVTSKTLTGFTVEATAAFTGTVGYDVLL